ncbi:DMT family transporter [Curtobacterium sp. Csp2]|uniref:DMT family transporter n=1 Tax=Curtobacterium sp. Csp2 TaxID=2495430 RepID=UPI0020C6870C|nr:SMR family transporter [Curtobacterium sp. Csp2]
MAWLVLVASGVLEAVWATALSASNGFKKVVPTIVFVAGMTLSMVGLAFAMTTIPAMNSRRRTVTGSAPVAMPHSTVSAAPVPVHTAYAVLIGMCRST